MIYLGTFSKILSPGLRLGWAVAPRAVLEKLNLGKQGADLCSSPMTQLFVAAYFAERGSESHPPRPAWIEYVERLKELYRRRRDVMLEALAEHFGGRARWTRPEGGLFIWATLDGVDTTDLMGSQQRRRVRAGPLGIHGREGRSGASSMRLNFAGVPEEDIREGIRRISAIVATGYGAVDGHIDRVLAPRRQPATGEPRPPQRGRGATGKDAELAEACSNCRDARQRTPPIHRHAAAGSMSGAGRRSRSSRAGARWSARSRCARALGRRARCAQLGHEVVAIDVGPELVTQLLEAQPDAAFIALHGSDGEDGTVQGLLEAIGIPYTGSGPAACMRCTDKALGEVPDARGWHPHARRSRLSRRARSKSSASRRRCRALERSIGFPLVAKPASQGSALGVKFARSAAELPGAIVGALSYDRKVVLERYIRGRDLAVSVLDAPVASPPADGSGAAPIALPVVEAIPREEEFYDYESRYEIGMTTFVCPAELPDGVAARAQELALQTYKLLGCHGVARVDLMLEEQTGELTVLETNVVPGLTETSLLPLAADAAEIWFDLLVQRILDSAFTR